MFAAVIRIATNQTINSTHKTIKVVDTIFIYIIDIKSSLHELMSINVTSFSLYHFLLFKSKYIISGLNITV